MVVRMGAFLWENFHGDYLNPHNTNTLSYPIRTHKRPNISAFLSIAMVLLELIINSPKWMNDLQGDTSSGQVFNTHAQVMTSNMQTPLVYPASMYGLDKAFVL